MNIRPLPWMLLVLGLALLSSHPLRAFEEIIESQDKSIENGQKWLLRAQNQDGSWGMDLRTPSDVACTSVSALALMAAGHTGRGGPSPENILAVRKAVHYILTRARRTKKGAGIADGEQTQIHTYVGEGAHSFFAVLFLSQVYGMTAYDLSPESNLEIKGAVDKLAETISISQEADGSWYKDTYSNLQGTALAWMALRSASSTGVAIKGATVEKTLKFIQKQFNPSTGLYDGGRGGDNSTQMIYASASAIRILYGMGYGQERATTEAADKLVDKIAKGSWNQSFLTNTGEDYPAALMLTHALIHEGGERWEKWFEFVRSRLLKIQNNDGSWTATSCLRGRTFVTACSLLCLEGPYRLLPLQDL